MDVVAYDTAEPVVVFAASDVDSAAATALVGPSADLRLVDGVAAALETVEAAERVDCLVTTAELPDGTGIELLEALRERDHASGRPDDLEDHVELPVIYVPGAASVADAEAATAAGATVYLPRERAADGELRERLADVVERYDRRRQLRRERELFAALLENAPIALHAKDADARHVAVSSYVATGIEHSPLGRTDTEIYGENAGAIDSYRDDLAILETGEPILEKVNRSVSADGEVGWYRTTKHPWRTADGDVQGLVGVTRAVTEAKERERQLERQRWRLRQFATFTSTELREPVTAALDALDRARAAMDRAGSDADEPAIDAEDPVPAGADRALGTVADELDRMQELIQRLLTMARPQAEAPELDWIDLADAVDRSWSAIEGASATLEVRIDERLEVKADATQLHRCLEHLFRDAMERDPDDPIAEEGDASPRGPTDAATPAEHVRVGLTESGFYVADDGPPVTIPDDPKVDPFEYQGAGHRVAIARDVAEGHGWSFDVSTDADGGARFVVENCLLRPASLPDATEGRPVALDDAGDVGGATPPGEASSDGEGAWTVRGGGRNVWRDVCEFHGVWGQVAGDVRIEARIVDLEPVHERCKAAVGFYDPADDHAPLAMVGLTGTETTETVGRPRESEPIVREVIPDQDGAGQYYRVDRVGDRTIHSISPDGEDWTVVDHRRLRAPDRVAAGLAVCSHSTERTTTATFEDVRVASLEVSE